MASGLVGQGLVGDFLVGGGASGAIAASASLTAAADASAHGVIVISAAAQCTATGVVKASVARSLLFATRTRTQTRTTTSSLLSTVATTTPTPTHVGLNAVPATTQWWEIAVGVQGTETGADSQPAPTGKGAVWEATAYYGKQIAASPWHVTLTLASAHAAAGSTGILHVRLFRKNGKTYNQVGSDMTAPVTLSATPTTYTLTGAMPAITVGIGTHLYVDVQFFGTIASDTETCAVMLEVGAQSFTLTTPVFLYIFSSNVKATANAVVSARGTLNGIAAARMTANADVSATASLTAFAKAKLGATAAVSGTAIVIQTAGATLAATAQCSATAVAYLPGQAILSATGTASGTASLIHVLQSPFPIVQISMTDPFQVPSWVTIGAFVRSGSATGGRQHEMDRVEASTVTLTIDDRDGRFRRWNTTGPYYNQLPYTDSLPAWPLTQQIATGACPEALGTWTDEHFSLTGFPATYQGMTYTGSSTESTETAKFSVKAGVTYRARVQAIAGAGDATCTLGVKWYEGSSLLSSVTATTRVTAAGSTKALSLTAAAPAPATHATLTWEVAPSGTATVVAFRAGVFRVPSWFDPGTMWGPGSTGFSVRRPVRVLASWKTVTYPKFYGYLTMLTPSWPTELNATMDLTATDGLKQLSLAYLSNTQVLVNTLYRDGAKAIWRCGDLAGSFFCKNALVKLVNGLVVPAVNPMAVATPTALPLPDLVVEGTATFGYSAPIVWDPSTAVRLTATSSTSATTKPALLGGATFAGIVATTTSGPQPTGSLRAAAGLTPYIARTTTTTFCMMFRGTSPLAQVLCTWKLRSGVSFRIGVLGSGLLGAGLSTPTQLARTFAPRSTAGPPPLSSYASIVSDELVDDGAWHMLHVTFPHVGADAATATVYLDGKSLGAVTGLGSMATYSPVPVIGALSGKGSYSYLGEVANVAVSDLVLSAATVAAQSTLARQLSYTKMLTGDLIAALLAIVGWPTSLTTIAPGNTVCQPLATAVASASFNETTYSPTGSPLALTAALDVITMAQQTEDGLFYQLDTGTIAFIDRYYFQTHRTALVTFSDNGTDAEAVPYLPSTKITQDDLDFWNGCQVQRDNGTLQQWSDAASVGRYGQSMFEGMTDLLQASTSDALGLAQWIVERFKTPTPRVSTLKLSSRVAQGAAIPWMLGLSLWTAAAVERARAVGVTSEFLQTSVVEGFSHTWGPTHWTTDFNMSPFELLVDTWFVLDTEIRGVLNADCLQY